MQRPYPNVIREGIARALGVKEARYAREQILQLYRDESEEHAKDGLAIAVAATCGNLDELMDLALDRHHGASRMFLLNAIAKSDNPRALTTLIKLGTDPQLQKEVKVVLRRISRRLSPK